MTKAQETHLKIWIPLIVSILGIASLIWSSASRLQRIEDRCKVNAQATKFNYETLINHETINRDRFIRIENKLDAIFKQVR